MSTVRESSAALARYEQAAARAATARGAPPPLPLLVSDMFMTVFQAGSVVRADMVKAGVPARWLPDMARALGESNETLFATTGLKASTIKRKIMNDALLDREETEALLGFARLVGQVQAMAAETGTPPEFDPKAWFMEWIRRPMAALGGRYPRDLLDTADGRDAISQLLLQQVSGAYA